MVLLAVVGLTASLVMGAMSGAVTGAGAKKATKSPRCRGHIATIVGTSGRDALVGTRAGDVFVAFGGRDRIRGRAGNDVICGSRGKDKISAGRGNDRLSGGPGNDRLSGGRGSDRLSGDRGIDYCKGGPGSDRIDNCEKGESGTGSSPENRNPTALDDEAMTDEETSITVDVLENDNDRESEDLFIASLGVEGTAGKATISNGGTSVQYDPNGEFESLGAGKSQIDSFTYLATDGKGESNVGYAKVTVKGVDDSPIAVDDLATVTEDDSTTIVDVVSNDTDIDSGPRTIDSVTEPDHGHAGIVGEGAQATYEPIPDYCGADSFSYQLKGGSQAKVLVTVSCVDEPDDLTVETTPELFPAFDRDISDYVVRCAGGDVELAGQAKPGMTASVDGSGFNSGQFSQTVDLASGQAFSFTTNASTTSGSINRQYHVRCLPDDFPTWSFDRVSQPQEEWYLVTPSLFTPQPGAGNFVVFFDEFGVPVWWYRASVNPIDAKVLSDGSLAWIGFGAPPDFAPPPDVGYELHQLNGDLKRIVRTVGVTTDMHDLQEVGDGNLLLLAYPPREHVDLSSYGRSVDETVTDAEIQEIDSDGNLVWSWNSKDHVELAESSSSYWRPGWVDLAHINSVEVDGPSLLISLRHSNAVYKISRANGEIEWKLGGTPIAQSLAVINDPHAVDPLGGQHDARLLADGTITIHDNGTTLGRPPRAVRYEIDETAQTATLLESLADPDVPVSGCCGSARRSDSGSWLMSWGAGDLVTEFDNSGNRTFRLSFDGTFSYRAFPVPPGRIGRQAMRAAMEEMHPR